MNDYEQTILIQLNTVELDYIQGPPLRAQLKMTLLSELVDSVSRDGPDTPIYVIQSKYGNYSQLSTPPPVRPRLRRTPRRASATAVNLGCLQHLTVESHHLQLRSEVTGFELVH